MTRWHPVALGLMLVATLGGCLGGGDEVGTLTSPALPDQPLAPVADTYYDVAPGGESTLVHNVVGLASGLRGGDVRFHTLDEVRAKLDAWNATYPDLVELRTIGTSRNGNEMWDVIVTDESVPPDAKIAPLFDGGHHGNEYGGSEIMLYTVDLLLQNHATNHTVQRMLRGLEIHVIPIVNPDGYVAGTRHNGFGVNLNRNYDIDWGNPLGTSNPLMGSVGATMGQGMSGVALAAENCGEHAFSEPETQAVRDVMEALGDRAAFYLTGHTATHAVIAPPAAYQPPFTVPTDHRDVLDTELQWVRDNTEYEAGRAQWGDLSAGLPYAASGSSMDYFYLINGKPAFTVEVEYFVTSATASDYPVRLTQPFEGLRYWMDATIALPMHLLANAEALATWQAPDQPALLPPGFSGPPLPDTAPTALPYLH